MQHSGSNGQNDNHNQEITVQVGTRGDDKGEEERSEVEEMIPMSKRIGIWC